MACSVVHHGLEYGSRMCHGMYHTTYLGRMDCTRVHSIELLFFIDWVMEHSMGSHGGSMNIRCRAGKHSSGMRGEALDAPHSIAKVKKKRKHIVVRFLLCVRKVMPRVEHSLASPPCHANPILIFRLCWAFEAS